MTRRLVPWILLACSGALPAAAQPPADAPVLDAGEAQREGATSEATPPSGASGTSAAAGSSDAQEVTEPADTSARGASEATTQAPKVAVIVAGDPDPELQEAARRIERVLEGELRAPFDPGLRAALRGEAGQADDGLEEVRRERRRLGLDEARDAGVLASLGRRAGASAVAIVRSSANAPELLVLDVRNGAFFEGALALASGVSDAQIARFVVRRARVSGRNAAELPRPEVLADGAAPNGAAEQPAEPDFFERFWPYGLAALLLAGMITAIALTSGSAGSSQPVLRFVPGGS